MNERDPNIRSLRISPASIKEAVKAKIPSKSRKYDTNDMINDLYLQWLSAGSDTINLYDRLIYQFYKLYKPRIVSIARRYRTLSPVFDEEDLYQTGLEAILQALKTYRLSEEIDMKFSTYLEWSIKNVFQRAIGNKDKYVEVYTPDEMLYKTMDYHDFQQHKKELVKAGYRYITKNKLCYISDITQSGQLEIAGTAMYDLDHDYTDSLRENEEGIRDTEEAKRAIDPVTANTAVPASQEHGTGKETFRMIDMIYRSWNLQQNGARQSQHAATIRSIYELYKRHVMHTVGPLNKKDFEKTVKTSISMSLQDYEDHSLPGSRFSLYLEAKTRREFRKAKEENDN